MIVPDSFSVSITDLGLIILPLGLAIFVFAPEFLFLAFVTTIPFTASSLINISNPSFGLLASHYMSILWFIHRISQLRHGRPIRIGRPAKVPFALLSIFVLVAGLSTVMPFWIDGSATAFGAGGVLRAAPVEPALFNFTQLAYLIYGLLIVAFVILEIQHPLKIASVVRASALAVVLVSVLGLYQTVAYYVGLPYPANLFNDSASTAAQGYDQVLRVGGTRLKRISSAAVEPSNLAEYLIMVTSLLLGLTLSRHPLGSRSLFSGLALVLGLLVLLLSTSTTAYVGLVATFGLATVAYRGRGSLAAALALLVATSALCALVALLLPESFELFRTVTVDKLGTYSGRDRLSTSSAAFHLFLRWPVLGLGWGSVTSYDLFTKLLSNTGVIGCSLFLAFLIVTAHMAQRCLDLQPQPSENRALLKSLLLCSTTVLLINGLTGFSFVFSHLWLLIGLLLGALSVLDIEGSTLSDLVDNRGEKSS